MLAETIETRLADAQGLLSLVADEWTKGEREHAAEELNEVCARLLVLAREMRAEPAIEPCEHAFGVPGDKCENCGQRVPVADEDALVHCCGHCGHLCSVNELKSGACPRCGTLKDGVLVVAKVDKWREMEEAPLRKPQGHAVRVDGWMV